MQAEFDSFVLGAAYTSAVCIGVKLLAISMQQKIIGEQLGHFISVRRFVQVNAPTMKAIKLILAEPGLKPRKVLILVGGPDWPTSVTTGIMRLSVLQMLLGSLPHAIPITLVVFAGGMLMKVSTPPTIAPLATLMGRPHDCRVTVADTDGGGRALAAARRRLHGAGSPTAD